MGDGVLDKLPLVDIDGKHHIGKFNGKMHFNTEIKDLTAFQSLDSIVKVKEEQKLVNQLLELNN